MAAKILIKAHFYQPLPGWGSKKHLSIENVQEIENFASAYLDNQTSYDFQSCNYS